MSNWGQIVSEIVAQLCLQNSVQTLLNFFGVDPKKIRRVCMEFSEYNWAKISETICPEMLISLHSDHYQELMGYKVF